MNWKDLESIISDPQVTVRKAEAEQISAELLESLQDDTKPLQAARVAYTLCLLQLKQRYPEEAKVKRFLEYLRKILKHEIQETELSKDEHAEAHLHYVRKLAEHYFHHLMLLCETKNLPESLQRLHKLRKSNHVKLLQLQRSTTGFWQKEQKIIKKTLKNHYLFVGFLLSIALFFAWNSFWSLADMAFNHWIYSTYSSDQLSMILKQAFLLLFSMSFVAGFVGYQRSVIADDEA